MLRHFLRIEIDNDLLTAMAERWRPETHTFHLPEGEMTITLKDVAILTGLPISGDAIIGSTTKPEGGWGPLIRDRLGFDMPTTTPIQGRGHPPLNAGQVSVPWLVSHMTRHRKNKSSATPASTSSVWWVDFCSPTSPTGGFKTPSRSRDVVVQGAIDLLAYGGMTPTRSILEAISNGATNSTKTRLKVSGSYMLSTSNTLQRTGSSSISSTSTSGRIDPNGWCKGCRRRDRWATTMGTCSGIGSSP
ncbi:unnamed protein product [Linum tenue]|uniref:Aminotransferase-like plant mobile domain-containing protein n=1 Tax=Linum tenue TaxID=586396 RepID=A0AAV0QR70_9ROSI|nr:unnamed protein product [Linum tenue]